MQPLTPTWFLLLAPFAMAKRWLTRLLTILNLLPRLTPLPSRTLGKAIGRYCVLGLLSFSLILTLGIVPAYSAFPEIRGVWITNNDTSYFMDQERTKVAVDTLADLNFNTLYPVVWNSGYVLYESVIAKREGIQPFSPLGDQNQDVLADLIANAHRRGLLVMPWFEFGFMAPPFSELVKRHPRWLTQRQDGSKTTISGAGEVVWMNPFHPQVQAFITELVMEVVTQYDIDGIQFDDHTALPHELGYDPYTINLYQQETKKQPPSNPKDPAWIKWRSQKITAFMAQLNAKVKAAKPDIWVSLSPATYRLASQEYLQDWLEWIRQGIVDEVVVQVYRTKLSSFTEPIQRPEFREAKTKVPTAVGILTGLPTKQVPMPLVQQKVNAATAQDLGTAFFYYKTLWDVAPEERDKRLQAFKAMFPTPAPRKRLAIQKPPTSTEPEIEAPLETSPETVSPPADYTPPPVVGIPITVEGPGESDAETPQPSSPTIMPKPQTPASPSSDGFPPEPQLDPTIPSGWY